MWNEDDRQWLLDELLDQADLMSEVNTASFWEGYREDELPAAERDVSYEEAA